VTAILRSGVDLVNVPALRSQIELSSTDFIARFLTTSERTAIGGNMASIAARWAAKEATLKALGTGIGPVDLLDIEVVKVDEVPTLVFRGSAEERANALGLTTWSLSLSHEDEWAIAFVVAMGENQL
jgi:holo-[acyl-carrier protein] synthase